MVRLRPTPHIITLTNTFIIPCFIITIIITLSIPAPAPLSLSPFLHHHTLPLPRNNQYKYFSVNPGGVPSPLNIVRTIYPCASPYTTAGPSPYAPAGPSPYARAEDDSDDQPPSDPAQLALVPTLLAVVFVPDQRALQQVGNQSTN